jgi:hypothetical protein
MFLVLYDKISTGIGCPEVMTILSQHELAMNGPPGLEVCCSSLAGFVARKSYSTSLWVAPLHAVAATNLQPRFLGKYWKDHMKRNNIIKTVYLVHLSICLLLPCPCK